MAETCVLPQDAKDLYDAIVRENGRKRSGCWDILAWKDGRYLFVEAKQRSPRYKDRIQGTQVRWFEAARRAGIGLECFRVYNWDIRTETQG
jgi:hypothetical protein